MRWVLIGAAVMWVSTMFSLFIGAMIKAGDRQMWDSTWDDIEGLDETGDDSK